MAARARLELALELRQDQVAQDTAVVQDTAVDPHPVQLRLDLLQEAMEAAVAAAWEEFLRKHFVLNQVIKCKTSTIQIFV